MSARLNYLNQLIKPDIYGLDLAQNNNTKYTKYDWHWKFDYYPLPIGQNYEQMIDLNTLDLTKLKLARRHYQHTADFNINTDIFPVDLSTDTNGIMSVSYSVRTGYTKDDTTNNTTNIIHTDIPLYDTQHTTSSILLHLSTNIELREDLELTTNTRSYQINENNPLTITYNENNEFVTRNPQYYDTLKSSIYLNGSRISYVNARNIGGSVGNHTNVEVNKLYKFQKGWNHISAYILLDVTKLNTHLFSFSLNPTIQYYNPNYIIDDDIYKRLDVLNSDNKITIYTDDWEQSSDKINRHSSPSIARDYVIHVTPDNIAANSRASTDIVIGYIDNPDIKYTLKQDDEITGMNIFPLSHLKEYHSGNSIDTSEGQGGSYMIDQILLKNEHSTEPINVANISLIIEYSSYASTGGSGSDSGGGDIWSSNIELITSRKTQTIHYQQTLLINTEPIQIENFDDKPFATIKLNNIDAYLNVTTQIYYSYHDTQDLLYAPALTITNNIPSHNERSKITVMHDGSVGIGTDLTHDYALFVNNISADKRGIYCADDITILSDRRYKKDIKHINSKKALDILKQIQGVTYKKIKQGKKDTREEGEDSDEPDIGFIAQDLQQVLPSVVRGEEDSELGLSVAYTKLIPILVEAVKELANKNNLL